ncbi:hypothetical protein H072_8171 [Dactylellina haptotyla CBS 200.50]|uniref:Granulins domain-containing protein n=1 Tax=Dactylellina haptotyla (strain CBS 200.50) TaxID=1284197 RepID=S8AAH0_DACHA|nr:hypothetical protein H072_8171 [Dactylellina haptotyla CBS 200.50]
MRIPSITLLLLLSIPLLPTILAQDDGFVEPGKVKDDGPGELVAAKSKRSFLAPRLTIPDNQGKPLPRWLPRKTNNLLQKRQDDGGEESALGNRAGGLICVRNGPSCGPNAFCNNGLGCCLKGQKGCAGNSCCSQGESCCSIGGGCCPAGYNCAVINGRSGCCLEGSNCDNRGDLVNTVEGIANPNDGGVCVNPGFGVCPSRKFCCPAGRKCLRDPQGKAACERVCEDSNFFVCPTNDFCCPKGSTCFVDSNGRSRCRVTIVTTITSTSPQKTTTTADSSSTTTTDEFTISTDSSSTTSTTSTDSATGTSSSTTTTETGTSSSTTGQSASPTNSGSNGQDQNIGPLPPPNGGLDNIFTNKAARSFGSWVPATTALTVGFVSVVVAWL